VIYRTGVRNRDQCPELHESETGLGFRGRKKKGTIGILSERQGVKWSEFYCSEKKKSSSLKSCSIWTYAVLY